jgi:hypothetical protein
MQKLTFFFLVHNRHFLLCVYGAVVLGFVLAGELKERKIIYILTGNLMHFLEDMLPSALSTRNSILQFKPKLS